MMPAMSDGVVFRSPLSSRLAGWISIGLVTILPTVIIVIIALGTPSSRNTSSQTSMILASFGIIIVLAYCILRRHKTRLVLTSEAASIGNILVHRTIHYDDVRVIELHDPNTRKSRTMQLRVQPVRGRGAAIDLPTADAHESFHALRELCPNVPAIGPGSTIYSTADPAFAATGRAILVAEFHRKAKRSLVAAVGCAIVGTGALAVLVFSPMLRFHPKIWLLGLLLPIASVALLRAARVYRLNAMQMQTSTDQSIGDALRGA